MALHLPRGEMLIGVGVILVCFLLNLSIASRSPNGAWMDEVTYVDPGLNLATGKGWTSSAWPWETDHEFYADNSPLYPAGLSLWVKVFGVSIISARAYCYFLAAVATFLIWQGTLRLNILDPAYRILWVLILSTEYAMNWMARNERYDVWIFFGLTLAWYGVSLRNQMRKYALIFLGCFLVPFAGFIGATYVVLLAGLAAVLTKFRFWREAGTAVMGAVAGVVGVGFFFFIFGRLQAFRQSLSHLTVGEQSQRYSLLEIFHYPAEDWGVILMISLLLMLSLYYWVRRLRGSLPWLGLGWGIVILMPCMMVMRGVFGIMYFYMLIIPLSLAILELVRQAPWSRAGWYLAPTATLLMGTLCLGGLPARLYSSWKQWDFRDPQHFQDFVRAYIHPDDKVFSDYPFYFQLRDYVSFVAMPHYLWAIPPDEARQVDVVLARDSAMPHLDQDASPLISLGGGWKKVAVFPTAEMMSKTSHGSIEETYTLYRREVASP